MDYFSKNQIYVIFLLFNLMLFERNESIYFYLINHPRNQIFFIGIFNFNIKNYNNNK